MTASLLSLHVCLEGYISRYKKYLLKQIIQWLCLNKVWGVYKVLAPTQKKKKPWESNVIGIKLTRDSIINAKIKRLCHVHPLKEKMYINLIEFPFKHILLSTVSTTYINPNPKKQRNFHVANLLVFCYSLGPRFVRQIGHVPRSVPIFPMFLSAVFGARNPWPNQCLWAAKPQKKQTDSNTEKSIPSRELTYPTLGKGKSSSKSHFWGIC